MNQKICRKCGFTGDEKNFPSAGFTNGKQYRRNQCMQCYGEYKKPRRDAVRQWLENYKKSRQCEHCGISDFRVIEFHHEGDKSFNVGDAATCGYGIKRLLEEICKCQCLCANCHRIVTYEGRNRL